MAGHLTMLPRRRKKRGCDCSSLPGIVIHDQDAETQVAPKIRAFVWGGQTRPAPTLPYGRWRGAA